MTIRHLAMRPVIRWGCLALCACLTRLASAAEPTPMTFGNDAELKAWTITGDVTRVDDQGHAMAGALRLGPGGQAVCKLRAENGSGRVVMWVQEDIAAPADPKVRRSGPCWGLLQADGRALVLGVLYAPYLDGKATITVSDAEKPGEWLRSVQYVGLRRQGDWHKYTFDMDADKGLTLACDDKPIARFNWNTTQFTGFTGIALWGDGDPKAKPAHTLWVDDIAVTLGGPMQAKPVPPPPPPPVTPDADPAVTTPLRLVAAVKGQHPRLLWTAADLPGLKARAAGPSKAYFEQLLQYLPSSVAPASEQWVGDATDAQRQGFWRAPTLALHYAVTGSPESLKQGTAMLQAFMAAPHWESGTEQDSGMGAANIDFGAALLYDALYDGLAPEWREEVRQRLLLQARRLYYGGHLMKNPGIHYWQNDPQNNHRWHRLAGLTATALACYEENDPKCQWILQETANELKYVNDWLPADGTFHDSPSYMIFGTVYCVVAMDMADRCLGTQYLKNPFFAANARFRLHTLLPGFQDSFRYGDGSGLAFFNNYFLRATAVSREADAQAGLLAFYAANNSGNAYGWPALLWFDPTLTGGALDKVPRQALYPDLGIVSLRDGWARENVAAFFKCGPYGGYQLNRFRNQNGFSYINVAHDHPDANEFELYCGGEVVATDDSYPQPKWTRAHNTILVNGKGQLQEGQGFTQPFRSGPGATAATADMTKVANLITWKTTPELTVGEGEAAGLYPGLTRFRRSFIWATGKYVLVLDDIRADKPAQLTWLLHSGAITAPGANGEPGTLKERNALCRWWQVANAPGDIKPTTPTVVIAAEDGNDHSKPVPRGQVLDATVTAAQWRLATLFDPWGHAQLTLVAENLDAARATVTITGPGFTDVWTWDAAADRWTPSVLHLQRQGAAAFAVTADDRAPQEWLTDPPATK